MQETIMFEKNITSELQEKEAAAFLVALKDAETREKIIQLLEEAGLLP